jgi:hypothetical protein
MYLGLAGHCVGTIIGEEAISAICFYYIEGFEAVVVAVAFCVSFE